MEGSRALGTRSELRVDEVVGVAVVDFPAVHSDVPRLAGPELPPEHLVERVLADLEVNPDRPQVGAQDLSVSGAAGLIACIEHRFSLQVTRQPSGGGDLRPTERIDRSILEAG